MAQVGVEPTASLVLSQGGLPIAYRAVCAQSGSRTRKLSGLSRAALPNWRIWAKVVPDGVEPSFPGCGPRVVAVGPRDHVFKVESPGVAPGSLACGASVVLLDHDPIFIFSGRRPTLRVGALARTHKQHVCRRLLSKQVPHQFGWLPLSLITKAEAVRLELTSDCSSPPVFKTGSSSSRLASVVAQELRRLGSNQHEDVQSVSSCR